METWIQLCYERDFDTGSPDGIKAYDRLSRFKHKLREEYQSEYYEIERLITTVSTRSEQFKMSTVTPRFDSVNYWPDREFQNLLTDLFRF